jgi:hypothetical protein
MPQNPPLGNKIKEVDLFQYAVDCTNSRVNDTQERD